MSPVRSTPSPRRSRVAAIALVALAALALRLAPAPAATFAVAAAPAPQAVSEVSGGGADATQPAVRLQAVAPPNFPMEVTPRCDILDNFGDPRSGGRTHAGMDILATLGQDVYAMKDGTLTLQTFANSGGSSSLSGNLWRLTASDGSGDYYIYAHLSEFAPGLSKGSIVYAGQLIGFVGDTGNAGPGNYHLHFEIHPGGGNAVNPLPLVTVPAGCKVW